MMREIVLLGLSLFPISGANAGDVKVENCFLKLKQDTYSLAEQREFQKIGYQMIQSSQVENKLNNSIEVELSFEKDFGSFKSVITLTHKTALASGMTMLSQPRFKMETSSLQFFKAFDQDLLWSNEGTVSNAFQNVVRNLAKYKVQCR